MEPLPTCELHGKDAHKKKDNPQARSRLQLAQIRGQEASRFGMMPNLMRVLTHPCTSASPLHQGGVTETHAPMPMALPAQHIPLIAGAARPTCTDASQKIMSSHPFSWEQEG
eukprot:1159630-Pelagomonas_calceolata.AAC.3